MVRPLPKVSWVIEVVARVVVPLTVTLPENVAPVSAAKVPDAYGYVTIVDEAYANVGNEEEALAMVSYVVDPYPYVE